MQGYCRGETFAFAGTEWETMRYMPTDPRNIRLYSLSVEHKVTRTYEYGKDFVTDGRRIRASEGSSLPDRRRHAYYGHVPFDHEDFPLVFDYPDYVVYADYAFECPDGEDDESLAARYAHPTPGLKDFVLRYRGKPCRILLFGDSITEGLDCVRGLRYFERLGDWFRTLGVQTEIVNRAIGGECSRDGLRRLDAVAREPADLKIVAYGMNDQNWHDGKNGISLDEYESNIETIASAFARGTENIVLVAPALSHSDWVHHSPNVLAYADTLGGIARRRGYGFADITHFWTEVLALGKTDACMLGNGINHPAGYGHFLYFAVLKALFEDNRAANSAE